MYLVINNFYNAGPEAMMDDLDRSCGWDEDVKSSDASDNGKLERLKLMLDDAYDQRDKLYDEVSDLRKDLEEARAEKQPQVDTFTNYMSTLNLLAKAREGIECAIEALMRDDRKIQAIKVYRTFTGLGLKECKDYVESLGIKPEPRPAFVPSCRTCTYSNPNATAFRPCDKCYWNGGDE